MSTTIAVLGGVGLFLLGMSVMTTGLKALAGTGLRATLARAAATPLSGTFWGAFVTLIIQSSSATTMTTIGLVSAGLLTFSQGLALVFGANIGTTGTGWLIALVGVRFSLTSYALPMVFVGALVKLLGRGRISASGASLAGFALVLFGLTTLQQGMSGLAEQINPADLPAVSGEGVSALASVVGVLTLVVAGLAMTAVMQSSTAAIAVTLSAHFAGAVALDQACALIIGQNIGTATSSAMAAIGASSTAKRLALAYVLFKMIAAAIALALFPFTTPLLVRAAGTIDGVTLLAAYHTAYNVVGVAILLPLIAPFTRLVERILPERASPLTRCLDPAALVTPLAAEEAVRRTVARALGAMCKSFGEALAGAGQGAPARTATSSPPTAQARDALRQAQAFMSEAEGPPESDEEEGRLTSTLHALDHAVRLADAADRSAEAGVVSLARAAGNERATTSCAEAMRYAVLIADEAGRLPERTAEVASPDARKEIEHALARLEEHADALRALQAEHRTQTLAAVAGGAISADEAMVRVEAVRRLDRLAYHAWRCAAHLAGANSARIQTLV
jgi:phosphate:Na+ symporter